MFRLVLPSHAQVNEGGMVDFLPLVVPDTAVLPLSTVQPVVLAIHGTHSTINLSLPNQDECLDASLSC